MKPEAQRIAIAEACGWVNFGQRVYSDDGEMEMTGQKDGEWGDIPRYLTDLNATHEAEKTLDNDQFNEKYVVELGRLFFAKGNGPWKWSECPASVVRATAAQRAEAFLRTIGKWEESA